MTDGTYNKTMDSGRGLLQVVLEKLVDGHMAGTPGRETQELIMKEHGKKLGSVLIVSALHAINGQVPKA